MVTNLPAEAKAKWIKVMDAKTPEEKIKALQEFLSAVPKHKGTENLVMWARRRMAELREESERSKRKGGGGRSFFIEKEGAGQVVLLGDFALRSLVMKRLTNAKREPKDLPIPGMAYFEDLQIQLINPPELIVESKVMASKIIGLVRNADSVLLAVRNDQQLSEIVEFLEANGVILGKPRGKVLIERARGGRGVRIVIMGRLIDTSEQELTKFLEEFGIKSGLIKIIGEVTLDDVEKTLFENVVHKPAVIVTISQIRSDLPMLRIAEEKDLKDLPRMLFESLDVIRVYTKEPGEEPSRDPLVLKRGSTVYDVARTIHSDIPDNLKYAKVSGKSVPFPQRVGIMHVLEDGDIVELRTK
jgi:ribosome-interacting GTPase 1